MTDSKKDMLFDMSEDMKNDALQQVSNLKNSLKPLFLGQSSS